jgi:hypothetical protein
MLVPELKTYQQQKAGLQTENPGGGYVVITDAEISGIWQ